MTPYQLKEKILENDPESLFFSRNNMNMGEKRMCYELKRKKPVKDGIQSSFFFCAESFELVWKARPSDRISYKS